MWFRETTTITKTMQVVRLGSYNKVISLFTIRWKISQGNSKYSKLNLPLL